MLEIIKIFELVFSVALIAVILLQPKRSSLNLTTFGNDVSKFERRGSEKTLHVMTISFGTLFVLTSLIYFYVA